MYLLYEGPSELDGEPIVALLTGDDRPSSNKKTGPMLQTWILKQNESPTEAYHNKTTHSICGDCPLQNGVCYVNLVHGPNGAWHSYKAGNYKTCNLKTLGRNRIIRLGAYGDPNAVPKSIWENLLSYALAWTGYVHTHTELKGIVQASCETEEQAVELQAAGWKTYRSKMEHEPLMPGEILCPHEKTGIQCIQCLLCDGKTKNIAANVHGAQWKIDRYANHRQTMELQLADTV
jgi:hypothetical protein